MKDLKKFINEWEGRKNIVFVTHYVVISRNFKIMPHLLEKLLLLIKI